MNAYIYTELNDEFLDRVHIHQHRGSLRICLINSDEYELIEKTDTMPAYAITRVRKCIHYHILETDLMKFISSLMNPNPLPPVPPEPEPPHEFTPSKIQWDNITGKSSSGRWSEPWIDGGIIAFDGLIAWYNKGEMFRKSPAGNYVGVLIIPDKYSLIDYPEVRIVIDYGITLTKDDFITIGEDTFLWLKLKISEVGQEIPIDITWDEDHVEHMTVAVTQESELQDDTRSYADKIYDQLIEGGEVNIEESVDLTPYLDVALTHDTVINISDEVVVKVNSIRALKDVTINGGIIELFSSKTILAQGREFKVTDTKITSLYSGNQFGAGITISPMTTATLTNVQVITNTLAAIHNDGKLTISDGRYLSDAISVIKSAGPELTIVGTPIIGAEETYNTIFIMANCNAIINGGEYAGARSLIRGKYATGTVEINAGIFKSSDLCILDENPYPAIIIKGGEFYNFDPSAYVPEGYQVYPEVIGEDTIYTVVMTE